MGDGTCKTVEMIGPGGKCLVNKSEVTMYKGQGYKLADGEEDPRGEGNGGANYGRQTNDALKALLDEREIEYADNAVKTDLVALLEADDAEQADED